MGMRGKKKKRKVTKQERKSIYRLVENDFTLQMCWVCAEYLEARSVGEPLCVGIKPLVYPH